MLKHKDGEQVATVKQCPRCGGDHKDLPWKPIERPVNNRWNWFALCPTTGAPLLAATGGGIMVERPVQEGVPE